MTPRATGLDPDELAALDEERDFLLRSLDDLEREHDAGDVDEIDYVQLKDDYTARAASAIRAVEEGRARFAAARRPVSSWRRIAIGASILAVAVLAGVLMAQASGRRDAGDSATGDINASVRSQVNACMNLEMSAPDPVAVLECYDAVLQTDPDNVQALTYRGWFLARTAFQAGDQGGELLTTAAGYLDDAIETDPGYADAHVFRAVVYDRQGDPESALAQLDTFDDLDAPDQSQQLADGLRARLEGEATTPTTEPG